MYTRCERVPCDCVRVCAVCDEVRARAHRISLSISFVKGSPGYANIGAKLAARNCTSVDELAEYSSVEFCALAKGCEIKSKARVYQAAIDTRRRSSAGCQPTTPSSRSSAAR